MPELIITTKGELEDLIQASIRKALSERQIETKKQEIEDRFLSIAEASRFLNLAKQTIYGYTSKGLIPFVKKSKRVLFLKSDLENWLLQGRKSSVQELKAQLRREGRI